MELSSNKDLAGSHRTGEIGWAPDREPPETSLVAEGEVRWVIRVVMGASNTRCGPLLRGPLPILCSFYPGN